nr:hypothetical protein QOL21_02380 [Acholeplasma laidlawii]
MKLKINNEVLELSEPLTLEKLAQKLNISTAIFATVDESHARAVLHDCK